MAGLGSGDVDSAAVAGGCRDLDGDDTSTETTSASCMPYKDAHAQPASNSCNSRFSRVPRQTPEPLVRGAGLASPASSPPCTPSWARLYWSLIAKRFADLDKGVRVTRLRSRLQLWVWSVEFEVCRWCVEVVWSRVSVSEC